MTGHLFCFGLGYTAAALGRRLAAEGWRVTGTAQTAERAAALQAMGFAAVPFSRVRPLAPASLGGATHLLLSIPPDAAGDPVFDLHREEIAAMPAPVLAGLSVDDRRLRRPSGRLGR